MAAAFHNTVLVTALMLALQGNPGLPRFSTVCTSLSCHPMDHGMLEGFLTWSPNRPRGKKSKGRKFWFSCISSLILRHSANTPTFTSGIAMQPLSQHPHGPSCLSCVCQCTRQAKPACSLQRHTVHFCARPSELVLPVL